MAVSDKFGYVPDMSREKNQSIEDNPPSGKASFGFRNVTRREKTRLVRDVFDTVANRYDVMNDLMSGGVHRLWKAELIRRLRPDGDMALIDVGGGTGDIAFRFLKRGGENVVVCDINTEMLSVGRDRALDHAILGGAVWVCGDAEALPLPDGCADAYVSAFCLRNVTTLTNALSEARRVLKPGGHFLCLEFSSVAAPVLSKLYDAYSFNVLPIIGQAVTGNKDAYRYLAESIRRFPGQRDFAEMIKDAGLDNVRYDNLSGGIAAIHSAWRI